MLRIPASKTIVTFTLAGAALIAAGGACAQVWGFEEPLDPAALLEGDGGVADGQVPGCTGEQVDAVNGLFVIGGAQDGGTNIGSDDELCGAKDSPCATISTALTHAAALGKTTVFVVTGTYTESITMPAGITISGGWNALRTGSEITYAKACNVAPGSAVTIQAPSTQTTTVTIGDVAGNIGLNDLRIETKAVAGPGESLYAILISGKTNTPNVTLTDVVAVSYNGGNGTTGANGIAGNPGDAGGCTPATDPDQVDGSVPPAAPTGARGSAADGGSFTATGIETDNGGDGVTGSFGDNGITPADPTPIQCVTCKLNVTTCVTTNAALNSGVQGASGCGGYGGGAGKGGGGGGSSVALYAWHATVTTTRGSLTAGNGGSGASGGEGAAGGAGELGPNGDAGTPCVTTCGGLGDLGCNGSNTKTTPAGTSGTQGGVGGVGGGGGSGAGGDSFAIVSASGTTLKVDPLTVIKFGTAGSAPAGGASGSAGATVTQ